MSLIDMLGVDQNGNASPLDARNTAATDPMSAIERVASQKGINPDHLIGLAKLETRLGDATIKGDGQDTYNLFNIKDFSKNGTGIRARDRAEGSNDRYRKYGSYDESVEDLIGLLERRYPVALNASTPEEFANALKAGGYATDPAYVQKLTRTIGSSANGSSPKNTAQSSGSVLDQLFSQDEAVSLISGGSDGLVESAYKPIKDRSFGDVLQDTGLATLKIGPTALKSVAEVGDMLTGGKIDLGVAQSMQRGMDAFDELGSDGFKRSKEGFAAVMQDDSKGIGDMFAYALDNPAILVDNVIPTVGSMFLPAGAAKAAAGGARLMGAAQPVVQKAAVATSIGAGAAQNAAQTFAELKDQSLQDRYAGAATSFAVSALMGIATGGGADGTIARRMAGDLQQGKIGLDKVKSFFKSIGKEALQEAGEESGNILGKYVGSGELPTLQSASKQVAFSGALGGMMGGGVDIATGQSFGGGGLQPNPTPAPNGPLTRALGAGSSAPQPAPTPIATPPAAPTGAAPVAQPTAPSAPADPQMAAMSDADLNALIEAIDAADDDAVTDEQWSQYANAITEINRRAEAQDAQADAPTTPIGNADGTEDAQAPTYMPGPEVNANRAKEQPKVVLQNRDRSGAASVLQMTNIAANPDFLRIGPSTEMTTGAPVVFGDLPATAITGRPETVVDGKGDRIQAQYAVVDAGDLIPSNNADGTSVQAYENGLPGKLRAVAGNGRTAGIQKAYQQGTAAQYRQDLIDQAKNMGLDADAIRGMQQPVLVRVMDAADVRDDMGDRTNISGTQRLSPVEQAANDARRLNLADLSFDDNGNPTQESLRQFISAMEDSEKGDLMGGKSGTPTKQAIDRLMAATFKQAYDSDELVDLYAQAPEPEARAILNAAGEAAGALAALKEMNPDFDVREAVADAVKLAVNASRQGMPLTEFAQNADLDIHPDAFPVARFLSQYANKPRQMANGLREWANDVLGQAEIDRTNQSQGGLFGAKPTLTREELFARLGNIDPNDQFSIQAREALAKREAEKSAAQERAQPVAIEDIPDDLQPEDAVEAPSDFDLEAQTTEQLQAQADERAAEENRQRNAEQAAEAKAQADAEVDGFTLTGSDRPADANPNQGDLLAADQPQQGDVLNNVGQPFTSPKAAEIKAKKDGKGGQVVPVQGGYVVRMPQNMSGTPSGTIGTRTDAKAGPGFTAADVVRNSPVASAEPAAQSAPTLGATEEVAGATQPTLAAQQQEATAAGLPEGARLEIGDRGLAQGMVRYMDSDGNPLSDWAEDDADAAAMAIEQAQNAPKEKLLRDHFVAASNADAAMRGNDAAEMLRLAGQRDALVKALVDAGYTQAEIGANSLGISVDEFNRLVKDGVYSRERGAPDDLFPKSGTRKKKPSAKQAQESKPNQPPARTQQAQAATESAANEPENQPQSAPEWWAGRSEDERRLLISVTNRLSGNAFANATTEWDSLSSEQKAFLAKEYDKYASGGASVELKAIAKLIARNDGKSSAPKPKQPPASTQQAQAATEDVAKNPAEYGSKNKLVSQSRAEELRAKLREKAKKHLFGGLDTEMMAWGTELAVFHLEAGVRKFSDLVAAMASDLGTTPAKLKPYLRSWYNGARDMMEDHGLSIDGMDSPETVRAELAKIGSEAAAPAAAPQPTAPAAPIEDFGEKLEGARKDLPPSLKEEVSDEQMASLPLSKIWPANAHEEIQNDAAAALAFAARQEIPAKPRQSVKVQRWVQKVKNFRALVTSDDALAGHLDKLGLDGLSQRVVAGSALEGFFAKVRLLAQLPRDTWGRVDKVREYPDAVRYGEDGQKTPIPFSAVVIDGEAHQFDGAKSIGPDEVGKIKELLGTAAPKKGGLTEADFEIRTYKNRAESFINRKGDKEMRPLKTFTGEGSGSQAREWLKANVAQAEAQWEAVKARDNVGKSDVRTAQNRQRVGADHRKGADVTAQMFEDAFGFRGVQFGNWVAQGAGAKDRQGLLNEAYDALMDLSLLLGVPSRAMSLDGSLGLSLGARGSGKAAAHFEPGSLVINLTKTKGAGSLAHEWFHALDNYFRRQRGGMDKQAGREDAYITYKPEAAWVPKAGTRRAAAPLTSGQLRQWLQARGMYDSGKSLEENAKAANFERDPQHKDGVRPQVEAAFAQLVQALNDSPMAARATVLDGGAAKGYWGRIIERGARSFENYVINKMALQGYSNDFLANIRSFDEWQALGKNAERYPYLTPAEEGPVVEAFDNLFETIETRQGDDGNVGLYYAGTEKRRPGTAQDKAVMQAIADGKSARDVLRLIANGSKDPFLRQVARLLLKSGITPNIQFGHIGKTKKGDPIHGQYRGKSDTIAIAGSAEYAAERIFMHEAMHAATMRALAKPGLPRLQLQKLLEHVRKQPGVTGFYGIENVDEFVAEVFTNPDFQAALRKMNAPSGSSGIKTAWDGFVRILRSILGLKNDPNNALSQALELGVAAVREDMGLRRQGARASGRANASTDAIDQTQTEAFKRWFAGSKVVDAEGKPLVVYHGTNADFSVFRDGVAYFTPRTDYSYIRNSDNNMPVFLAIKNPYRPNSQSEIERIRSFPDRVEELIAQGYDGMIWAQKDNIMRGASGWGNDLPQIVAFYPGQVKSAIGNNGDFDPVNPDIRRSATAQPLRTPAATIRAAITRAYGKLLGQLESKGLVTLAQTEAQAIEAAAQARAKKTGGDVAQIKRSLTAAMQGDTDLDVKRSANGAVQGFFDPQTGQSFLIADNLSVEAAPGVLMHEVGIHMAADGTMQPLFERVGRLLKAQKANPFMQRVQAKLDAAGETSNEEVAAYMVEAYENDRAQAPASVRKWLADLLAAVKAWLYKKGFMDAGRLTVADIAAVARANAKSIAVRDASKDAQPEGIEYSVAQQLQSDNFYEAYRRALESGRNLGENEITEGLAGKSKGGQRRGVLGFAGAKNPSTSTVFWESEVLGGGYYTTAMMRGKVGKREFIMFAIPERAAPEGTPEQLTNAVLSNKVILHTAARELSDGSWEFAVDGAHPTSPYYDELIARGELEPVANGYHRLKIPGASNSDFLRETARRLSMALDGKTPDIRYERATGWNTKRGDVVVPASKVEAKFSRATAQPTPAAATWVAPSLEDAKHRTAWDNIIYTLQDKMVDVKRVVQAIRETGQQIEDDQDVYLQEELYHARVSHKSQEFVQKELDPMVKLLADRGVELADFEQYLHARHAPEANRVMMERNPTAQELQDRMDAIYAQIEPLQAFLPKVGAKEQARLQRLIDQGIRKIGLLTTVQPWRGSEEDRQKLSGMSNDEAAAVLASISPEAMQTMQEAARQFDAIVKKNRQEMVDYDLENQDTVDGWADMFEFYVPLMREDEGNAQGTGQGFSIKGREVKSRTGSTKKVVDIVANLAMQRERTIVRGEKNRVSQALVGLASANPNPDFWRVGGPDVERKYDPRTGTVKTVTNPNYKNLPNVVTAKVRGADGVVKEVAVVFNEGDNRALRMAATIKNLDGQTLEGLHAMAAPITRYLAAMSTQYNPIFGITNLARDLQGAMVNLAGTPLADQKGKIAWLAKNAIADIYRAARADRQNQPHTGEWGKWWDMFQEDGGPTGYRDIFQDSTDRTKAITNTMNPDAWMESAFGKVVTANGLLKDPAAALKKGGGWVLDWLGDYNLAMENGIRVSTYRAAVESGMSRQRAASLAKNITVNFNRKGQMALKTGALYAFFNAAVQGTARIGQALVTMEPGKPKTMRLSPLGKKVVYGGILLGALQAAVLAAMGFDDENPPDFVRERNTIIPIGGGKFITIPMPLGLHVFPGIGRHAVEFMLSGGKDPSKRAINVLGMMVDSFYPLGSAGISAQTLTPTAADPFIALIENKDYAGRPIARESMDKNVPGHELTRTTATWLSQGISEGINWITGGDKYVAGVRSPTPDQIDYLVGQATGGVGREALKAVQTAQAIYTGEELPMHKVPLLGRFFGTANGSASQSSSFYAKVDEAKRIDRRIDGLREDGQRQEAQTLERSHQFLLAKARIADRQVTRLRREKRKLLESGAPREQVRNVERQMADAMRRFNEATVKP